MRALDVAKRLLEEGFHAPTVYFPLIVDEALMIEPTETESLQTLEALADALERIAADAHEPDGARRAQAAPHATPVRQGRRGARRAPPRPDVRRPPAGLAAPRQAESPCRAESPCPPDQVSAGWLGVCLAWRSAWWSEMACMMAPPTAPMNSGRFSAAQSREPSSDGSVPLKWGITSRANSS